VQADHLLLTRQAGYFRGCTRKYEKITEKILNIETFFIFLPNCKSTVSTPGVRYVAWMPFADVQRGHEADFWHSEYSNAMSIA